jgi:rod shape determining protein RodA
VLAAMLMGMLFVYGAPWRHFVWMLLAGAVTLALIFSILPGAGIHVLQSYQVDRITAFLHPDRLDPQQNGYNLRASIVAVSHGGVGGTGVKNATQTLFGYLPEHATDFVFAVVGEERGFVGAAWLIALYALLLWRGLKVITKSRSTFGSLVAAGVVSMLLFQITINIGMTIGLAPITGIPLPFMSFGGSHTLTNLLAIGVLQAIHVHAQSADEPRLAVA